MRIGFIGCGSIGKRHLRNLLAGGGHDFLVMEPDSSRRSALESEAGVQTTDSFDALARWRPEILLIASPTVFHRDNLTAAIDSMHCHIFVEKPISHVSEGLEYLAEVAAQKGIRVMTGCNMRFHPCLREMKKLVDRGTLGRLVWARIEAGQYLPDWHPAEDYRNNYSARSELGGGCLLDYIHEIDYSNWLFGRPVEVASFNGKRSNLEIDTEDAADVLVRYESGLVSTIHVDYVQRKYARTCKIVGESGTAEWEIGSGRVLHYDAETKATREIVQPEGYQFAQLYVDEMAYFLECIRNGERPMSDIAEAATAVRVVELAKASQVERRFLSLN